MGATMDVEEIAAQLGAGGLCVCSAFLTPALAQALKADLDGLYTAGGFVSAGTGQGAGRVLDSNVRRDEIHWLEVAGASPAQLQLWERVDALRQAFNRQLFLGITAFEGHYAAYPPEGFYKRHLDCFHNDDARVVSVIIYLNQDWQPAHGGHLRIHGGGEHGSASVDVAPVGGTLVCFLSREKEHEVLVSHAARFSVVGWFKSARQARPAQRQARLLASPRHA